MSSSFLYFGIKVASNEIKPKYSVLLSILSSVSSNSNEVSLLFLLNIHSTYDY